MNPYRLVSRRLNLLEKLIGATYSQLALLWIMLILGFAAAYFTLIRLLPAHGLNVTAGLGTGEQLLDSLYFSVVTATTVGYGDISALGFAKVLVMIQSTLGLLVFTVLVGKLVSQRQDVTLHEVHRMTFEGVFYHIRHVLFIVRKDFDQLIAKIEARKQLTEGDWDTLSTAYLQAHSLIEEIPDLYSGHSYDLHNVDLNREKLLFESVHRTLSRICTFVETMDKRGVEWKSHEQSMKEMRRLIDMIDGMMLLWNERSPFHEEDEFEQIRDLTVRLHVMLKEKIA